MQRIMSCSNDCRRLLMQDDMNREHMCRKTYFHHTSAAFPIGSRIITRR